MRSQSVVDSHEEEAEGFYAVSRAEIAPDTHNLLIRLNQEWVLPLAQSFPFMVQSERRTVPKPYPRYDRVITRVGHLDVDVTVWLL